MTACAIARRVACLGLALAGCASETILDDAPRAASAFEIAPYEVHVECARLAVGDRLDYRFEAQAPVTFNLYYEEGTVFLAPVSHENVTESSGVYRATEARRYCLRWEAGQQGALLDFRIRLLRAGAAR